MNFEEELKKRKERAEEILEAYLPAEEGFAAGLARAMNYSMRAPGKRLRPVLMEETYRMFGGEERTVEPFMAAMEMIHTSSLIHDDLPAIDNDDWRRGRKTTHVVYGEAMGILAGDALLNYAYETAARAFEMAPGDVRVERAFALLTRKTGIYGMLGGQSVDVTNEGRPLNQEMLDYIYLNKTSALIEAAMMTGAILAGADSGETEVVRRAAEKIGLAFQIRDDILDVTASDLELGKPAKSDEKNHKVTYVTLRGLEEAIRDVETISREAVELLEGLPQKNEFLLQLVKELVSRRK
ncbi:MAG: polyprenyl synthetase family protein [Clostridiales bacterium]|uniref:Farnesyl diphosphate synthase n=1 Tax=Candidatus Pullilachnospira stercoravium TaxID=2840913 RepID=A0A9D1NVQ8_9FIRM|nr:polyprenyl synthetase family protein [Clostridiales bacterium]HIV13328.1 polyprenyl synthetase family protein [Candidatus Pullilachnospira stercoravium]